MVTSLSVSQKIKKKNFFNLLSKMTVVINMFGGSGCGKSTTAALLFARLKLKGAHVELVREYVKYWAWNDRQVKEFDQLYLLGKQSAYHGLFLG